MCICAYGIHANQSTHLCKLISLHFLPVRFHRMHRLCELGRFGTDCIDMQADSSLPCLHCLLDHTLECLSFGSPETINFPFGTNGKLMVLGVPKLSHIKVNLVI